MAESWNCPHCGNWIGSMQVHQECARKQDEKRRKPEAESDDSQKRTYAHWPCEGCE